MKKYTLGLTNGSRIETDSHPTPALVDEVYTEGNAVAYELDSMWRLAEYDMTDEYFEAKARHAVNTGSAIDVKHIWRNDL